MAHTKQEALNERRLVAILFADIQGYSSLMQKDEAFAFEMIKQYEGVLDEKVTEFRGEIIKNYGDGSLVVFQSVADCIHCAKSLQEVFLQEPVVPLRIGIHLGDVIFHNDDIFGNDLNIASRIESIGVPGSVLVSENIYQKVKNQTNLSFQSIGKLKFKNIENKVEVFALNTSGLRVPSKNELGGKLERKNSFKFLPWVFAILALPLLYLLSTKIIFNQATDFKESDRIAIIPFKNNTNDPSLDILGDMAADWINKGFMDLNEVDVVSPFTVRAHLGSLGISNQDNSNNKSFTELTGAQNLITGTFYKEQNEIIFKLDFVDALSGNIKESFDLISGSVDNKTMLIDQLRGKLLGYWTAQDLVVENKIKAPDYDAYKIYLELYKKGTNPEDVERILSIDSMLHMARIDLLNHNRPGIFGDLTQHVDFLKRHQDQLSDYEKKWFVFVNGLYTGDKLESYKSLNDLRNKYPKDPFINHEVGSMAFDFLNNPELCIKIYEELPLENIKQGELGNYLNYRLASQIESHLKLDEYDKAKNLLDNLEPSTEADSYPFYLYSRICYALLVKDEDLLAESYDDFISKADSNPIFYGGAAIRLLECSFLPNDFKIRLEQDSERLFTHFTNIYEWKKPSASTPDLSNLEDQIIYIRQYELVYAGLIAHRNNDQDVLNEVISRLKNLTTPDYAIATSFGCATAYYDLARLYTQIGDLPQALKNLKEARRFGIYPKLFRYEFDPLLEPLFEYPEFQALLVPEWP